MKNSWIFPIATLVIGIVGGFLSGRSAKPASEDASSENVVVRTRTVERSDSSLQSGDKRSKRVASTQEISQLLGSTNRVQALTNFYANLTADQLLDEANKLDDLPVGERMMASLLLFGRWAEVDPIAAMDYTKTMGFGGMFVRPTVLKSWASVDPANAAKYYEQNPREFANMGFGRGPMSNQDGASIIAGEWARQDPIAAFAWATSLAAGKNEAIKGVVDEVAQKDPAKAAQMLAGIDGGAPSSAYITVAEHYGAANFAEAKSWIQSLPVDQQDAALTSAISGLAKIDPQAAAAQVALLQDQKTKNQAIPDVIRPMAKNDPQAAADFLSQHGDDNSIAESMRYLMPNWVAKDPDAALFYATNLPAGKARDSAFLRYVYSNTRAAPADLIQLASQIENQRDRSHAMSVSFARWMKEDPVAAKAEIQQTNALSEAYKNHLLNGDD